MIESGSGEMLHSVSYQTVVVFISGTTRPFSLYTHTHRCTGESRVYIRRKTFSILSGDRSSCFFFFLHGRSERRSETGRRKWKSITSFLPFSMYIYIYIYTGTHTISEEKNVAAIAPARWHSVQRLWLPFFLILCGVWETHRVSYRVLYTCADRKDERTVVASC